MQSSARYRVNEPDVLHQTIDGETIVINLGNGAYFSLDAAAAVVWAGVEHGLSEPEIVALVAERFVGAPETIAREVGALLRQMLAEALVVPAGGDARPWLAPAPLPPAPAAAARPPFLAARLEKYTDLEDLLLLDPVHEVDDRGWPKAAGADPMGNGSEPHPEPRRVQG